MDFRAHKAPFKVIKEGALGGTNFRDIYSGIYFENGTESHGKNLMN